MTITFPHIGNTYIIAKAMLDDFGVDTVIPPLNSDKTLEIGLKYCGESYCLPFKMFVGNMMQAHEMGADTMLITGGCGPCRMGYFGEMLKKTVKEIGIKMDIITLEVPDQGIKELGARIKKVSGTSNLVNIVKTVNNAKNVAVMLDELERTIKEKRAKQAVMGSTDKIYRSFKKHVINEFGSESIMEFIDITEKRIKSIKTNPNVMPLKVGFVGEIYTSIEPYANFRLEEVLGNMGVEVNRQVTLSQWIINDMFRKKLHLPVDLSYEKASKAYLGRQVGGHTHHTIGNSVLYADKGYDGVIHLYPLGCMPEIVSQAILPSVEEDHGIPIMTIIRDEMTGEAGFNTRLEAFIDLLKKRREEQNAQKQLLFGN